MKKSPSGSWAAPSPMVPTYPTDTAGKVTPGSWEKWWLNTFPKTPIKYVNAGIGSTGSIIGVHQADKDLLASKPDFVILEYSVNDGTDQETKEAYESLVRKILNAEKKAGAPPALHVCTSGAAAPRIPSPRSQATMTCR